MKYTKQEAAKELDRVVTEVLSKTDPVDWLELMEEMTDLVRTHAPKKHPPIPVYGTPVTNHAKELKEKLAELQAKMKTDPYGTLGILGGNTSGADIYSDAMAYGTGVRLIPRKGTSGVGSDDIPF